MDMSRPPGIVMNAIVQAILHGPGELSPRVRKFIYDRAFSDGALNPEGESDDPLIDLADKVILAPGSVQDEDIDHLLQLGYTEDEIFEAIVTAAVGTGIARLECGLRVLTACREGES